MKRAAIVLLLIHITVLLAGFVAPYDPAQQNRDFAFVPPTPPHFPNGRLVVYGLQSEGGSYREDRRQVYPVRLFIRGHLFGVDNPGRIFLLGTDAFGRDQFSRIVYGGRISLTAGLLGTLLTLALGTLSGALAGFYGGWSDAILMRLAELVLALPWLYLLLAVRAFLPLSLTPAATFLSIVGVIGAVGWARPARLIRGIVLTAKEREYVYAARGFGASDWHLLIHHILPETRPALLMQASLLIPQYILAEVTLSFLGLGTGEPAASWGSLLAPLRQAGVLTTYWWMALPSAVLLPVVLCYYRLARGAQGQLSSRP
jgi:peptide/nickel transport system permease protein